MRWMTSATVTITLLSWLLYPHPPGTHAAGNRAETEVRPNSVEAAPRSAAPKPDAKASAGPKRDAPAGTKVEIRIDNFSFNEQTITVRPGTAVTWINHDDAPHKIVSTDKTTFASPVLDTDGRFSFTFSKAGTYEYFCSIHPMMTGKVIVK